MDAMEWSGSSAAWIKRQAARLAVYLDRTRP
jgi:hypothetical protein